MPPSKRSSAARDREINKRSRVAYQIGDRVSVLTREWGNEYARSVHNGRYLTGRSTCASCDMVLRLRYGKMATMKTVDGTQRARDATLQNLSGGRQKRSNQLVRASDRLRLPPQSTSAGARTPVRWQHQPVRAAILMVISIHEPYSL